MCKGILTGFQVEFDRSPGRTLVRFLGNLACGGNCVWRLDGTCFTGAGGRMGLGCATRIGVGRTNLGMGFGKGLRGSDMLFKK